MTNVFATPEKVSMRSRLFEVGIEALQGEGWKVERVTKSGKASLRRISKGKETKLVSIRTTQDTWIAFPRDKTDSEWVTLSGVDLVVAVSVDDREVPRFAQVHILDGDDMRSRFDRAYAARQKAGYKIPLGRGVWVSLYHTDADNPVTHVGAGAGLKSPPIARVPLEELKPLGSVNRDTADESRITDERLTIPEAKRRLALTFGVDPSSVKITIEA